MDRVQKATKNIAKIKSAIRDRIVACGIPPPIVDNRDYGTEVDKMTSFTAKDFDFYAGKNISEEQVTKIVNYLRGKEQFKMCEILYNKNVSREFVLELAKSMPANPDDSALAYCLRKTSRFCEDKEILWECARIQGKGALFNVLLYEKELGMGFIYGFIKKTHDVPGNKKFRDHEVIRILYEYSFDNKELIDLILSHYDICSLSLKNIICAYTKNKITDKEHLMDVFKRFLSPDRKIFICEELKKKFPNIIESILILEKESKISLPEILDYFIPMDDNAYMAIAYHYPEREDLLKKAAPIKDYHIFYRTKMTMSEEKLALVTKRVDVLYPIPLPYDVMFNKAYHVKAQELINHNPMSFLRRYISDIDEVVKDLVPVPTPKACILCKEDFGDELPSIHNNENHVDCYYLYNKTTRF